MKIDQNKVLYLLKSHCSIQYVYTDGRKDIPAKNKPKIHRKQEIRGTKTYQE